MSPTPLDEAADPATPPDRLAILANSDDEGVARTARGNPNLDEFTLRRWLAYGDLATWANPQVPFLLLTTSADDSLVNGAKKAVVKYLASPEATLAPTLRETVGSVVVRWWSSERWIGRRISYTGFVAESAGYGSPLHRQAVQLGVRLTEATLERVHTGPDARKSLALVRRWLEGDSPALSSKLERARTMAKHAIARSHTGQMPREPSLAATYEVICFSLSTVNANTLLTGMLNDLARRLSPDEPLDSVAVPLVAEVYPEAPLAEELRP